MASTSGTIYTGWDKAGTGYNLYRFYLSWQLSSQDISGNSSNIKWQAGVEIDNNGYLGSNSTKINSIHINGGSSVGSGTWSGLSGNGKHQLKSGSKWVDHNSDGTKTISLDISGWFIDDGNFSGSGSYTLPTIPRNSQVTTNDSGHYDLGTALTIYTNRKSSSFTHTITLRMDNSSGAVLQTINSVGSSVVWTPTSSQITTMQNHIPTANSLKLYIDQYNNQVKAHSNVTVTAYLRDASPTFDTFTYKDSNTTVTAITGNDQVLVKGQSTLEVDIPATDKMTAIKGASEDHYAIAYDGSSQLVAYDAVNTVSASFSAPATIGTRTIQVTAYDSRNNATKASQDVIVYDYAAPTITTTLTRENNFGTDTTVHIEGTYTPLVIGGANKNSLTTGTLQYRYQEDLGTWGSWTTVAFTADTVNGAYSVTDFVVALDNTKKYNFEFHISDKFGQVTTTNSVDVGTPIMFVGQNNGAASVGINKMPENGALDVAGDVYSNGSKLIGQDTTDTLTNKDLSDSSNKVFRSWETNNTSNITIGTPGNYAFGASSLSLDFDVIAGCVYEIVGQIPYSKVANGANEFDFAVLVTGMPNQDRYKNITTSNVEVGRTVYYFYTATSTGTVTATLWGGAGGSASTITAYSPNIYVHRVG